MNCCLHETWLYGDFFVEHSEQIRDLAKGWECDRRERYMYTHNIYTYIYIFIYINFFYALVQLHLKQSTKSFLCLFFFLISNCFFVALLAFIYFSHPFCADMTTS